MTSGRRRGAAVSNSPITEPVEALLSVRIAAGEAPRRAFGRRECDFAYGRLYIPSLVLDYTFLFLRQAGVTGEERFLVWAGTLAAGDAFVSTVVLPRAHPGYLHGEIEADVTGRLFEALDQRDLVPLAQVHSHPRGAGISATDRERPLVAQAGFLSIIVPDFAFVPLDDVARWGVYEYRDKREWRTLPTSEKRDRLVVDDSIIGIE